jgi:phage baseplate assembly protein V
MSIQLKYGIVSEVKKGFVRVKFEEDDGIVSDWLPALVKKSKTDKESNPLEINEHVVCIMDRYCEEGICLGAIYNEVDTPDPGEAAGKFRKLFSDGTLIEYDKNAHKLTVDVKGTLEAKATGDVSIDTNSNLKGTAGINATIEAPAINLTGNVVVSGSLEAAAIAVAAGGSVSMKDGAKLNIDGGISTTGEIDASDVKAGTVSLLTHVHPGVQSGPSLTGPGQ